MLPAALREMGDFAGGSSPNADSCTVAAMHERLTAAVPTAARLQLHCPLPPLSAAETDPAPAFEVVHLYANAVGERTVIANIGGSSKHPDHAERVT